MRIADKFAGLGGGRSACFRSVTTTPQRRIAPVRHLCADRHQRARLPARAAERRRVHPAVGVHSGPLLGRSRRADLPTVFTAMFMHGELAAPRRQHALPVDLRRQRRGPLRARQIPGLLSAGRHRGDVRPVSPRCPARTCPTSGASGAIAGVLGAYILMFPQARVNVLLGRQVVAMPALIVLGLLDRAAALQRRRLDRLHDERRTSAASPTWRTSAALPRAS